jgi:integrase
MANTNRLIIGVLLLVALAGCFVVYRSNTPVLVPQECHSVPRAALSDLSIRAAKIPPKSAITLWDAIQPKLGLRVTPAGAKSFVYMVGSGKRKVLGRYPELSLKDARARLTRLLAEKTLGFAPVEPPQEKIKVSAAITLYIEKHCERISKDGSRYPYETKLLLNNYLGSKFKDTPLDRIGKSDVAAIIDGLSDEPSEASHAFTAIRGFFSWCVDRGHADKNPCDGLRRPSKPASRDRVLTTAELKAVYLAAEKADFPYGAVLQLLAITGQRRGEIAALRWDWIDDAEKTITFPASVTKNKLIHIVPYGDMMSEILRAIPRSSDYLFPAKRERRKGRPASIMSGWGKLKAAFDTDCPIADWTLHDLRRTASTMWAEIGVPEHINDRLLNHITAGTKQSAVARVYNRYSYLAEKRDAVARWEAKLSQIVT